MSITLSREVIQQHNGKYSLAPRAQLKSSEPAPPDMTGVIQQIAVELNAGRVEQRSQIAEMLAALVKPEQQHENWTVTVAQRDAKGRIQQVDFTSHENWTVTVTQRDPKGRIQQIDFTRKT